MAQARLSMRKIRETLRLKFDVAVSERQIAATVGASRSTVQDCLRRCREAGLRWPLPVGIDDATLMARLYPREDAAPILRMPQ